MTTDAPAFSDPIDPPAAPASARWKPLRLGLVNLFKYDDQPFHFEDGHLLLRGDNGTGKSRVLALTLPFLLDGRAVPGRVEPDGDAAKSLAWNLLLDRHDRRSGYAWAEFGRTDADGTPRFCTLAIGLEAVQSRSGVKSWFGVTEKRVGGPEDAGSLSLLRDREPLSRGDFKEAVGEGFSDTSEAYRARVNRTLFGLSADRYAALVDLLIELRRPQLSRDWSDTRMAELLDRSLRPVPEAVLGAAARAFEGLEEQKRQLADLSESAEDAERFSRVYRVYARSAARRAALPVRQLHSAYEEAARTARRAVREAEAAEEAYAAAEEERAAAATQRADAEGVAEELQKDPATRTADRLRELREAASAARDRADAAWARAARAAERHARAGEHLDAAAAKLEARDGRARESLRSLADAAEPAALVEPHATAAPKLGLDAGAAAQDAAARRLDAQAKSRLDVARRLGKLDAARAEAAAKSGRKAEAAAAQRGRVDAATAEAAAATAAVTREGGVYVEALRGWADTLAELRLDAGELAPAARRWARGVAAASGEEGASPPSPVPRLLQSAAAASRSPLLAAESAARAEAATHESAAEAAAAEVARLESGHHEPPPRPHTRGEDARPEGRPGAPLWRLLDFQGADGDHAGLEAALEAAGLLDAWVEPGGRLAGGVHDAVVAASAGAAPGAALSDRLAVLPEAAAAHGIDAAAVEALLGSIALLAGDADRSDAPLAVAADGSFRSGPLRGRWFKPAVAHLGETAREAERRRRVAALERERAEAEREAARARREAEAFAARVAALERELSEAPTTRALDREFGSAARVATKLGQERTALVAAEEAVRDAERAEAAAAAALAGAADDAGLGGELHRLGDLKEAVSAFRRLLDRLTDHTRDRREAAADRDRAAAEAATAATDATAAREAADAAALEHTSAAATHATLEATSGADAREIERRLAEARTAAAAARARGAEAQKRVESLIDRRSRAAERKASAEARRFAQEADRDAAIEALRALAAEGFLEAADPPPREEEPGAVGSADRGAEAPETAAVRGRLADAAPDPADPWSPTRGVELARAIEAAVDEPVDTDAFHRIAKRLQDAFHELKERLGRRNDDASLEQVLEAGLLRARVRVGPDERPVHEVVASLAAEIRHRNEVLSAEEQQVIQNHLIGEAGEALVGCIHGARQLVQEMSGELSARTTATGMRLRFRWQLDPADPALATTRAAVDLLQGTVLRLRKKQRDALGAFLQQRIDDARAAEPGAGWLACLTEALDYRRWHRFTVDVRRDDGTDWEPVNRRTFGRRSGGEKALLLTMPQFAAAATHYRAAARSPRLVLLDEAFAGIDPGNRSGCMELIRDFDLDFVMTSDRESGCYPALAGNAIYHLSTTPGSTAVLATRQVWNGHAVERAPDHGQAHPEPAEGADPPEEQDAGLFGGDDGDQDRDTDP